jgi:hypothetical protein
VIFVPEWPKGEFVSILASFYVWTKSLMCKDEVNRDSTFRVMSVDSACKSEEFQVPCQPSGRSSHPVRMPDGKVSFVRTTCSFRPDPYTISRRFCSSLLRSNVSAACPDAYQFSNGSLILSKFQEGKINQPSGRVSP